jgi:hypothetical protein
MQPKPQDGSTQQPAQVQPNRINIKLTPEDQAILDTPVRPGPQPTPTIYETYDDSTVEELTVDEARALFDKAARERLGISGEEFLRRYDANDIPPDWPHEQVSWLAMLTPFGR